MSDNMSGKHPVSIILDTDIEADSDDVGAVAVLHALADQGAAHILGMICSSPLPYGAECLQAFNTFYHRPEVRIGTLIVKAGEETEANRAYIDYVERIDSQRLYNRAIPRQYPHLLPAGRLASDSTEMYRKLLSGQPDHSVTICAVGLLGPLSRLLQSSPDRWSELSGVELVRRKVKLLVSMAIGTFPQGRDRFNWKMDAGCAEHVLNHWPTPIAVSEYGDHIRTGSRLAAELDEQHPVRLAYRLHLGGEGKSRCSWDQVAVMYAALGEGELFAGKKGHQIRYESATGEHQWVSREDGRGDIYVQPLLSADEMAVRIEDLMIAAKGPAEVGE